MANLLYYSKANPVKMYLPSPDSTYHSRFIDDWEFFSTIEPWQQQSDYFQPYEQGDKVILQLTSNMGPHNLNVLDMNGTTVHTEVFALVALSDDDPTLGIYEVEMACSILPVGAYRFQLQSGTGSVLTLISNKIDICSSHPQTLFLEYWDALYHEGVFPTSRHLLLRVEGSIKYKSPSSKGESYEDQALDETLLSAVPFDLYELTIGDQKGVPDYLIGIVNRAFTFSQVLVDGRKFTKPVDNKFEVSQEDGWAAKAWRVEVRESVIRGSLVFVNNAPVSSKIGIVINADSKGFDSSIGGTVGQIQDVQ